MDDGSTRLDQQFLQELLEGDREFAEELFETYFESADTSIGQARQMLEEQPAPADLYRPFHTLKGASASVGLTGMRELCRDLEAAAKAGRVEECRQAMPELKKALERAKARLRAYLDSI